MGMKPNWNITVYTIIVAFVLGGASGIMGTAWTSSYLSDYAVQLTELTTPLRLSQERPRNFPSSYKDAVDRLIESSLPSIAEIYQGQPGPLGYLQAPLQTAVVLTTDGWMAMSVDPTHTHTLVGAEASVNGKLYPVTQSVYDSNTQILFAKVNADGLPVASFGKGRETRLGEQVFVARSQTEFVTTSIARHAWPEAKSVSSDTTNHFLYAVNSVLPGEIVFNLNGEVVGIGRTDASILPFENILPGFRSLLEKKMITHPTLGVQYVDLAHAKFISGALSRSLRNGALLYGSSAIEKGSAAKTAGLKSGDILLSINGETINETQGLDELLSQYHPSDTIQVRFDRDGKQLTVSVVLGEVKQ